MRCLGAGYLHDGNAGKGAMSATFRATIKEPGSYEIFVLYPPQANRATNVPVTLTIGSETRTATVNQKKAGANQEASLGAFTLPAETAVSIRISNEGTDGHVIVDGVQIVRK
jgi:glycerate-2-kinase